MAKLTSFIPLDLFDTDYTLDAPILDATGSRIVMGYGDDIGVFMGKFTYDSNDNVYGRLQSYREFSGADLLVRVTGMNVDAHDFQIAFDQTMQDIYTLMFDGRDTMNGSKFSDKLRGFDGPDTLYGRGGADLLAGDQGNDKLFGGFGDDTLNGNDGRDRLLGQKGHDLLSGGAHKDTLIGGTGNDTLIGGTGNDRLTGGKGADVFVFTQDDGTDRITDFRDGVDLIEIQGAVGGFDDLEISQSNGNAVVSFEGTDIILVGIDTNILTDADFIFA